MQAGTLISGIAHGALILAAALGGLDWWQDTLPPPRITKVTLVRAAELDVQSSAAPQVPMAEIDQIAQPEITLDNVEAPSLEAAVNQAEIDVTDAPEAADASPDVSGLLQPEDPEVVVVAPTVDSLQAPNEAAPDIFQPALNGNELNAPVSMSRPPPPRNAPRIDSSAAARPPEDAVPNTDSTPEVTSEPGETVEAPAQDAGAPEESTTEITPDGQQSDQISAFAPQTATRPPRNPRRANVRIPAPAPEPDINAAVAAALQAAQEASQTTPPVVAELTRREAQTIGSAIVFNEVAFSGTENIEQYVTVVSVDVDADGNVVGDVTPFDPVTLTGTYVRVFRDARIAILKLGKIPLPAGKFPNGATLHLRFDPSSGVVGMN